MKKYFKYLFQFNWLQTTVLITFSTLLFCFIIFSKSDQLHTQMYLDDFSFPTFLMFFISVIIIIQRFADLKNEHQMDLFYSLPISRRKLFLTHFLYGLLQVVLIYTIMFFAGLFVLMLITIRFHFGYVMLIYFSNLPVILISYLLFTTIFLRANHKTDGMIYIGLWLVVLMLLGMILFEFFDIESSILQPYYGIIHINDYLEKKIAHEILHGVNVYLYNSRTIVLYFVHTVCYFVLAILAGSLTLLFLPKEKNEQIGRISKSKFGYVFLIPCMMLFSTWIFPFSVYSTGNFLYGSSILIAGFVLSFIYRKGVKLRLIDLLLVVIPFLIGIVLSFLTIY